MPFWDLDPQLNFLKVMIYSSAKVIVLRRIGQIFRYLVGNLKKAKSGPVYWRLVLEDLGGGFIKLAQILAMRYEILPERYCREFSNLFDRVRPVSEGEVRSIFLQEFGRAPEEVFQQFSYKPRASASFGQVHPALFNGQKVAVKIQRPNVKTLANADIAIIKTFGKILDALFTAAPVNLKDAIREWERWTKLELDYEREADNALRLRNSADTDIYIPMVYKNISTSRILVTEFLDGVNLNDVMHRNLLDPSSSDRKLIGRTIVRGLLLNYFKTGFFHADPHPGNIILLKNGGLGWVDFGIMGEAGTAQQNYNFANFIKFSAENAAPKAVSYFKDFMDGLKPDIGRIDRKITWKGYSSKRLENGIVRFLDEKLGEIIKRWAISVVNPKEDLSQRSTARHFLSLISTARSFGMEIPMNLLSFIRSVVITDMVCLVLDPQFNMKEELRLFFENYPELCEYPKKNIISQIVQQPITAASALLGKHEVELEQEQEEKQRLLERYLEQASRIMERILEDGSRGLAYFATTKI